MDIDTPTDVEFQIEGQQKPILCRRWRTKDLDDKDTVPSEVRLLFTHGAGGGLGADAIVNFANGFCSQADHKSDFVCFKGAMNLKARVTAFGHVISHFATRGPVESTQNVLGTVNIGGRSMGARAAVMVGTSLLKDDQTNNVNLVLCSYPLVSEKGESREQILLELPEDVHVLFIIGDRDQMCPLARLNEVREKMKCHQRLLIVRDADHGMSVKGGRIPTQELGRKAGALARTWVSEVARGAGVSLPDRSTALWVSEAEETVVEPARGRSDEKGESKGKQNISKALQDDQDQPGAKRRKKGSSPVKATPEVNMSGPRRSTRRKG